MKITKAKLKQIIKEELEGGVKEGVGSDPLPVLEKVVGELLEAAKEMENAPSDVPASDFASFTNEMAMKIREALVMMDDEAGRNPGGSIGE